MPTKRMIVPDFWHSETMAELTFRQRLLFIGLFSNADDQGRLTARAGLVRSMVFPVDDISLEEVIDDLQAIAATDSILLYQANGRNLIQIRNWWSYQSPSWAYPSKIPSPAGWTDRERYQKGKAIRTANWDHDGGFLGSNPETEDTSNPDLPSDLLPCGGSPLPSQVGSGIVQSSLVKNNVDNVADAPASPPKKPSRAPPDELLPDTKASRMLMGMLQEEAHAKKRRGPKKFPSLACKQKFDTAAERLGDEIESAIKRACEVGALSVPKATDYVAKWNVGSNKPKGGTVEHRDGKRRAKVGN